MTTTTATPPAAATTTAAPSARRGGDQSSSWSGSWSQSLAEGEPVESFEMEMLRARRSSSRPRCATTS
jgi:hypothetical protein